MNISSICPLFRKEFLRPHPFSISPFPFKISSSPFPVRNILYALQPLTFQRHSLLFFHVNRQLNENCCRLQKLSTFLTFKNNLTWFPLARIDLPFIKPLNFTLPAPLLSRKWLLTIKSLLRHFLFIFLSFSGRILPDYKAISRTRRTKQSRTRRTR